MKSTKIAGGEIRGVRIEDIKVGRRFRKDMGNIEELAESICNNNLLQPLVITRDGNLVAGQRRLEALRRIGWTKDVPVYIVHNVLDAAALLKAERDENTCRKEFTRSEAVAIGKALEELERPKAKERQRATQAKDGEGKVGGGNLPPPASANGKTRDKVAEAVGMSGRTYDKAKVVIKAAEDNPENQPIVEEMDRTGKVDPAYKKARKTSGREKAGKTSANADAKAALEVLKLLVESWGEGRRALMGEVRGWSDKERWAWCDEVEALSRILGRISTEMRHSQKS